MADFPVTDKPVFSETMTQVVTTDRGAPETFNPRYQVLLDNDNYLKNEAERVRRTVIITLLAAGWSAAAPYSQKVAVPGIKATDEPEVHMYAPKELAADAVKLRQKLAGMITAGETEAGYITLYCGVKKPAADFAVLLKGVSG